MSRTVHGAPVGQRVRPDGDLDIGKVARATLFDGEEVGEVGTDDVPDNDTRGLSADVAEQGERSSRIPSPTYRERCTRRVLSARPSRGMVRATKVAL